MKRLQDREDNTMQRCQRLLAAFTAAVLLFCVATGQNGRSFGASEARAVIGGGGKPMFSDVRSGDWFEPFVSALTTEGVISGYPDGSFRPQEQVTTGQFLAMVIQAGQRGGVVADGGSQALAEGGQAAKLHWAQTFYEAARTNDLIFSDELPKTSLDQPIPRLWMAVISSRMTAVKTTDGGALSSKEFNEALEKIIDVEELHPYSYEIVNAYARGLLSGYPDGSFRPEGFLTRAEAATVIYKLSTILGAVDDTTLTPEDGENETLAPAYGFELDPAEMSVGTRMFWCQISEAALEEMKTLMTEETPDLAKELYRSFEEFARRAIPEQVQGKQGLRKE
ncbi:MAG: S-layer homology domain-containing protein, partial [Firmicutes bacterium]|nr:S-layer homology domain-containing protein [Bacillota bacterium]